MYKKLDILDESNKILREVTKETIFPISNDYRDIVDKIILELTYSQIEEYEKEYNLRPGMGLAFPQLGIKERIIVIVYEVEPGVFDEYVVVNPKMISHSNELITAESGEGCLSVERPIEGHIPRYARVTIEGFDLEGKKIKIRAREDLAIAFQHELDHLEGILFFDRIDPNKPIYTEEEIRFI